MTEILIDKNITPSAKVLYMYIKEKYIRVKDFTMSNKELGEIFDKTPIHISNMVSELRDAGYINIEFEYQPGTKGIRKRHIQLIK